MDVKKDPLKKDEDNGHEINGICCKNVWLFSRGDRPKRDCQGEVLLKLSLCLVTIGFQE